MHIYDLVNEKELHLDIQNKYINVRNHPLLPLRIYNYSQGATFDNYWSETVRICRGLITDHDGNIISRPYKKFWNLNQEDSLLSRIINSDSVEITRKLDGMLGVLWEYDGNFGVSTRGSFESDGAKFATQKIQKFVKYHSIYEIPKNITLIFEIIAKHLRIVKEYDFEGLVLTGAIDKETGRELRKHELTEVWNTLNKYAKGKSWCRLVEFFDEKTIDECINDDDTEEEGYVITGHFDGSIVPVKAKIKLAEYLRRHKLLTGITPNKIHNSFIQPIDQFFLPNISKEYLYWVRGIGCEYTQKFFEIYDLVKDAHKYYIDAVKATSLVFSNENDIKNHSLRATKAKYGNIANMALLMEEKDFLRLYENIWKSFEPVGEKNAFFKEGKKE